MSDWPVLLVDVLGAVSLLVVGYYAAVTLNYLGLHLLAVRSLERSRDAGTGDAIFSGFSGSAQPGVAVVVPAYNEEETIAESLPSFLNLDYPDLEVIVVNDGSTDGTLAEVDAAYDLEPLERDVGSDVPAEPIHRVYRSRTEESLLVVDKENGGKSDALNAGIWLTDQPLFCAVDSDTLIEQWALAALVQPFVDRPEETVAAGGTVRVANGCEFESGRLVDVDLSTNRLVSLQAMEYLRAFYMGRLGLARVRSLVLISGAFGVFRTEVVREIGGYSRDTVTEDFDLVVRLHRHLIEAGREYSVDFVPDAVAWTEVPVSWRVLGRQRRRWFRGQLETLARNWRMVGNPRYGRIGLYALPYFLAVETLGPLVEGAGYLLVPASYLLGVLDIVYLLLFFGLTVGIGIALSGLSLYGEHLTPGGYDEPGDLRDLLVDAVLENVGYRQWRTVVAWRGLFEYLRGEKQWGDMERQGLDRET